jgi:twitching motility protein PilJ
LKVFFAFFQIETGDGSMKKLVVVLALACLLGACQMLEDVCSGPSPGATEHLVLIAEVQVGTYRMEWAGRELVVGNFAALDELHEQRAGLNRAMRRLRQGDPGSGLSPLPEYIRWHLDSMEETWRNVDRLAGTLLERGDFIIELTDRSAGFASLIPHLQASADGLARELVEGDASLEQVYMASRQLVLADRMLRRVGDMMMGGSRGIVAADWLSRDAALFGRVLDALALGDEQLGVTAVEGDGVLSALMEVIRQFEELNDEAAAILEGFTKLQNLQEVADSLTLDSEFLVQQAEALAKDYATAIAGR